MAKLLGLQVDDVKDVTLQRQINVRGNITEIPLKIQEVSSRTIDRLSCLHNTNSVTLKNCARSGKAEPVILPFIPQENIHFLEY